MMKLERMTREMCHEFYREFQNDPAIYADMSRFTEFVYDPAWVDAYFDRQAEKGRLLFAVIVDDQMVGEVKLHSIDRERKECAMGIHLRNDSVKGKGYGTRAEKLAVQYAFEQLGMDTVNADAILKNTRSQHVLEKAGFRFVREDEMYRYYRVEKAKNNAPYGANPCDDTERGREVTKITALGTHCLSVHTDEVTLDYSSLSDSKNFFV